MAFKLNDIDIYSTYGILAGKSSGGNISLEGCFSLPARIGDCLYDWGDENGVEGYTDSDDIMFGGRELVFNGIILGNNFDLYYKLKKFYNAIYAFTDLVVFSTPYGDFTVQVISVEETHNYGGCWLKIRMREPVVDLTGGVLPETGRCHYTIDDIPTPNFGLRVGKSDKVFDLPEIKEQYFTKYGQEGYQIVYHRNKTLTLDGLIVATTFSDFTDKIKALYLAFSSEGERVVKKNNEISISCFAKDGFSVTDVNVFTNLVAAKFSIELVVTGIIEGAELLYEDEDYAITENEFNILI